MSGQKIGFKRYFRQCIFTILYRPYWVWR